MPSERSCCGAPWPSTWRRDHLPLVSQRRRSSPTYWRVGSPFRSWSTGRFPVTAMLVSNVALIVYSINRFSAFPGYAMFALVFGVGLHVGRGRALVAYLGGLVGLVVALRLQPAGVATASSWISTILTVTVAWLAGENLRARRSRLQQELAEGQLLAQQREDEGRRAVSEERLRIARDLHDVVAHSMSVIAVQAGVANHVIDDRPELVREALNTIEITARQGLVEMRRLLGVLRSEENVAKGTGSAPRGRLA